MLNNADIWGKLFSPLAVNLPYFGFGKTDIKGEIPEKVCRETCFPSLSNLLCPD